jgi:hypothetical protein
MREYPRAGALAWDLLSYPIRQDGWLVVAIGAGLLALARFLGPAAMVGAAFVVALYLFHVVRHTADGGEALPRLRHIGAWTGSLQGLVLSIAATLLVLAPAGFCVGCRCLGGAGPPPGLLGPADISIASAWAGGWLYWRGWVVPSDPAFFALLLAAVALMPAIWLNGASGTADLQFMHPTAAVRATRRLGLSVPLLAIGIAAALLVQPVSDLILDFRLQPQAPTNPLAEAFAIYVWLVLARAFGHVLYTQGYAVGDGPAERYAKRILGSVLPDTAANESGERSVPAGTPAEPAAVVEGLDLSPFDRPMVILPGGSQPYDDVPEPSTASERPVPARGLTVQVEGDLLPEDLFEQQVTAGTKPG